MSKIFDKSGSPVTTSVTIPAGMLIETDNPLAEFSGLTSGQAIGAVDIRPTGVGIGGIKLHSTIIADQTDGSRYGQFFPTVDSTDALVAGESAHFSTTHDAGRYRVNAGVMALTDGTRVLIQPVDPQNTPIVQGTLVQLNSSESAQLNDLASTFDLGDRSDYMVRMTVEAGSATGYVSVLDGLGASGTSDPTTIFEERFSDSRVTLLELGSIHGLNEFSNSATISNLASGPSQMRADFFRRGTPGVASSQMLVLPAGKAIGYADLVDEVFGIQGDIGTVVLTVVSGGPIAATGREYAVFRGIGGAITGTAGQRIPGLLDEDLLTPDRIWHFIGLRQRATSDGLERSHLAVFNPGDEDADVTVSLFGESTGASPIGSITRTVRSGELIQINNIIDVIEPDQVGGVHRLELTTTGAVFSQAFRVNATGDPITIDAL